MEENLPNEHKKTRMEGFGDYLDAQQEPKKKIGSTLPGSLTEAFTTFVRNTQVKEFSRNLRSMILEFATRDDAWEALYWEDLFFDLADLFRLLDAIEDESPELMGTFTSVVSQTPARRLSRNLRSMILEFATGEDTGRPRYWKDLFVDLEGLFRLLDVIESEAGKLQEGV